MAGLRGFAQVFVKAAAKKGLGANKTLSLLKSKGLGYRRATFLSDYRMYAKIPTLSNRIKYVRRRYRLTKELFLEPKKFMTRRFAFVTEFNILKPDTGETFKMKSRVSTDKWMTRGQAENAALHQVKSALDRSNYKMVGGTLLEAYHSSDENW